MEESFQRKFICDGRQSNCTIDASNISVKFLESSFFSIFEEGGNRAELIISIKSIINITKLFMGFCVHYVSPKLQEKQGARVLKSTKFEFGTVALKLKENDHWINMILKFISTSRKYPEGKKLFVMINPFSGKGEATEIWNEAKRILKFCGTPFEEYITQSQGDAYKKSHTISLENYYGIVTVSGDGLLSEVINGVFDRKDYVNAIANLTFGIIPGGSGNGLTASLNAPDALTATYALVNNQPRCLDIYQLRQEGKSVFGFLCVAWANLAAIDIDSEKVRWLGPIRYDFQAFISAVQCDAFRARLSFLPENSQSLANYKSTDEQILHDNIHETEFNEESNNDWVVIEDDFSSLHVCNVNKIMISSGPFAPHCRLSDGFLDIIYSKKLDRIDYSKFLLDLESGDHIKLNFVKYYKTREFKLEPLKSKDTIAAPITLDGEVLTNSPIHVKVHQGLINVFCDGNDVL